MIHSVTAYENAVRQVRIAVRDGSQLSIDRFNGRLLNVETTAQRSGNVTVVSVMVELELYIDPNAPEPYKNEGVMTYRVTAPNDDIPSLDLISYLQKALLLHMCVIRADSVILLYDDQISETVGRVGFFNHFAICHSNDLCASGSCNVQSVMSPAVVRAEICSDPLCGLRRPDVLVAAFQSPLPSFTNMKATEKDSTTLTCTG